MSKLIFFVDDDRMILNLFEYTINNRDGYDVKTFATGEECINNLHLNPKLIVLDHFFIGAKTNIMNGLEILKRIREINKVIPVIILTSLDDEKTSSEYKNHGASAYIPKNNYFIDKLLEVIHQYL